MRIAIDLQACQTASRFRGIGRYSLDLTRAILAARGEHEIVLGLDGTYPAAATDVAETLRAQAGPAALSRYYYPGPNRVHGDQEDVLRPAAEVLIARHYQRLAPDSIHVHSLFEGYGEHAGGMSALPDVSGAVSSATLYDLIPLIFAEHYFRNADYAAWYRRKLAMLHKFDLLLCISEATKRDAVRLLGIDERRLTVVHAGIEPQFTSGVLADDERSRLLQRYGIREKFVLYTGNDDFRKNVRGAVAAFAAIPPDTRKHVQLVLNQIDDEAGLRQFAGQVGLAQADLVITGFITDADLIALFRSCELFFFPSLYEGFGLPVLEAMACGAPTLAADNSSITEIVGRRDALFDASRTESITQALTHALDDGDFRRSLSEYGLDRAAKFTWQRSAELALAAWEDACGRRRSTDGRAVSTGVLRPKLAMVTPLPPERTGIADYVVELLPALSRHFNIDLYTTADPAQAAASLVGFNIYPWQDLPARAQSYAHVVYQFGNSPFHSHMVELLDQVPGAVVLHDFFLSSMLWHMQEHEGYPDIFNTELERSHGRHAVAYFREHEALAARRRFPASRRIIERAVGILAHSDYSLELCQRYFPAVERRRWVKIPQPRRSPMEIGPAERSLLRAELGVGRNDFLLISLGFLADTKLNHVLLDALADQRLVSDAALRVVFVGQNDAGAYGRELLDRIGKHPLRERIEITGFAEAGLYQKYLYAADCAVQLRTDSRGETSRGVLDCMAHGLPVILNAYATFREFPANAVRFIPAAAPAGELADELVLLRGDAQLCGTVGGAAREVIQSGHSPKIAAEKFAEAIRDAAALVQSLAADNLVSQLGNIFSAVPEVEGDLAAVKYALERSDGQLGAPRLFLDLSEIVTTDYGTGIHRVVRSYSRELLAHDAVQIVPVAHSPSAELRSAEEYVVTTFGVPHSFSPFSFSPRAEDVLFLLDSAWDAPERFKSSIEKIQLAGGRAAAMVYDLIPLRFPQYCVDYMPAAFEHWLRFVVQNCDLLICISHAVADDLDDWIRQNAVPKHPGLRIGRVHLGCDFSPENPAAEPGEAIRAAMEGGRSVLMVGTLEPRKRYDLALDAFEQLWDKGMDLRLVIIGKRGWNVESLAARIESHPEYGRRLFWLRDVSDDDLRYAYRGAQRVLLASDTEGFGLPIVEAAHYGRPLLLSDILAFREVAGEHASYFQAGNIEALVDALRARAVKGAGTVPGMQSWREAAAQLQRVLYSGDWTFPAIGE